MTADRHALTTKAELFTRIQTAPRTNLGGDDSWASRRRAGLVAPPKPTGALDAIKQRTADRTAQALELAREGLGTREIGERLGLHQRTVTALMARAGAPAPRSPRRDQVLDALAAGAKTVPEVARRLRRTTKAVAFHVMELHQLGRIRRIGRGVYVVPVNGGAA